MKVPKLSQKEKKEYLLKVKESPRHRYAKILHKPGAKINRAINFMMHNSYMRPHYHPNKESNEKMQIMFGKMAILFFDNSGIVTKSVILEKNERESIVAPAFTWHTYVALSGKAASYDVMKGVYDPATFKTFPKWAPKENTPEAREYLKFLKEEAIRMA